MTMMKVVEFYNQFTEQSNDSSRIYLSISMLNRVYSDSWSTCILYNRVTHLLQGLLLTLNLKRMKKLMFNPYYPLIEFGFFVVVGTVAGFAGVV